MRFAYFLIPYFLFSKMIFCCIMADHKKVRATAKGKITKLCNRLSRIVAEDDELDTLPSLVANLKSSFSEFSAAHDKVVDSETDETVDYEKHYCEVQSKYVDALTAAKSAKEKISRGIENLVESTDQSDMIGILSLPKVEIEVFSGDSLKYYAFIKSFEANVDKMCKDSDACLARLLQYTTGDAHAAILSSVYIGGDAGYKQALDIVKSLYGSKHRVTEDVVKTIRQSKLVKYASDMRQLSHELRNAYCILDNVGSLAEANAQVIIFDIVSRLQNFVQNRWTKEELFCVIQSMRFIHMLRYTPLHGVFFHP